MEFIDEHFDNDQIFMNYEKENESIIEQPEENDSSAGDS